MTFCYAPWTNVDISPKGDISPCCKFQHKYYDSPLNINSSSLEEYQNSATVIKIKKEFKDDQWPKGCERCQIEEQNNIKSKRQLDFDRWKDYYHKYDISRLDFITASVAFGNTCNLKCITCGPESSSLWYKEYLELYQKDIPPNHFYKEDFVFQLVNAMPSVIHLDIPGGEPFVSGVKEQKLLLKKWIDMGLASQIGLHYTTNATIFPEQDWWDLWAHFRNVDIQLSIDAIGSKSEYIRFPSKWAIVEQSVKRYVTKQKNNNIQLSVSHTVSAFNIYYLDEFFNWCQNMGLPRPWLGRVHNPPHMRPTVWPTGTKEKIVTHLKTSTFADAHTWADLVNNNNDSEHFSKFCIEVERHDRYRGCDFKKIFPELAPWMITTKNT